jgi:hypothetical protein
MNMQVLLGPYHNFTAAYPFTCAVQRTVQVHQHQGGLGLLWLLLRRQLHPPTVTPASALHETA